MTLEALSGFSGALKVVIDDYSFSEQVSLNPNESKAFQLSYTPSSPGTKTAAVTLVSDSQQYQDGWWGSVQVENQRQWWEDITTWFQGMVDWVLGIFTGKG